MNKNHVLTVTMTLENKPDKLRCFEFKPLSLQVKSPTKPVDKFIVTEQGHSVIQAVINVGAAGVSVTRGELSEFSKADVEVLVKKIFAAIAEEVSNIPTEPATVH